MEENVENTEVTETFEESTSNDPEVAEEGYEELTDSTEEEQEESIEKKQTETIDEDSVEEEAVYSKTKVQKIVKDRLSRHEKKYKKLLEILKAGGFEGETVDDLTQELIESYREQNIEVPDYSYSNNLSEKQERALAKLDADEVIDLGEVAMEERFIELYNKPSRTLREETEMQYIGQAAAINSAKEQFIKMGLNPDEIMNDKSFMNFASKFNPDVPLSEVYQMHTQINGTAPVKPKSTGSVQSKGTDKRIKDSYTREEALKFTREDYRKNPGLLEAVEKSMAKWSK